MPTDIVRMTRRLANLFIAPFLSMTALFIYEFLFYATKPSPLAGMSAMENAVVIVQVLAVCAAIAAGFSLAAFVVLIPLGRSEARERRFSTVATFVISAIGFTTVVENFLYTMFGFGLKNTDHALIKVAFIVVSASAAFFWCRTLNATGQWLVRRVPNVVGIIVLLAALTLAPGYVQRFRTVMHLNDSGNHLPNVVILSSDGVNAESMSVYGYDRETTPFLASRAAEFAIFENSFANNYGTYGSMASMLTGMSPITTGVVNFPQILSGAHTIRSLPRILGDYGFYRSSWSVVTWANSQSVNMVGAFNAENGKQLDAGIRNLLPQAFDLTNWLIVSSVNDLWGAMVEALFIGEMANPMAAVRDDVGRALEFDAERLAGVLQDISAHDRFFINSHFMHTHDYMFPVNEPHFSKFSAGKARTKTWETDFYDDAIRDFDGRIKRVYKLLEASGKLENTILIITSDHGKYAKLAPRIPLLIRFPERRLTGRFSSNVQRLDIAPTILDSMNIGAPSWMDGASLLDPEAIPADRLLFGTRWATKTLIKVPVDQFLDSNHAVTIIYCDKMFRFLGRILAATLREPFVEAHEIDGDRPVPVIDAGQPGEYPCSADAKRDLDMIVGSLRDRFRVAGRIGRN